MNRLPEARDSTQTILLVDDRQGNLLSLEAILDAPGRRLLMATNGNEALTLALKNDIALILLDVQMPDMDGFEVAELLHRNPRTRDIPVIFCTAISKEKKYVTRGFDVGAFDYLFKPLDADVLTAKVRAFLELDLQKRRLRQANDELVLAKQQSEAAERQARAAQEQLQALLDCAPVTVVAINAHGLVRFSNASPGPAVGSPWLAQLPAGQRAAMESLFRQVLATGRQGSCDTSMPLPDGGYRFFVQHLAPIRDGAEVVGVIVVSRDVTEQKRAQAELESSRRLATVGSLAAGIAHEINTPVQFVNDSLFFVRDTTIDLLHLIDKLLAEHDALVAGAPSGEVEALVTAATYAVKTTDLSYLRENLPGAFDRSLEGLERVAAIVRSMKEFSRPAQTGMAPADINRAIADTLTVARNEYKYVAELETDFGDLPPVMCHVGDINQVVLNIVVNAARAIGDIVKDSGDKGRIVVATRHDGDDVVISVSDTGGGIPENVRDHVFDPFFTTREVGKGLGQGLAVAWALVREKHGGELSFRTTTGEGTTFLIRIPVAGRSARRVAPADPAR